MSRKELVGDIKIDDIFKVDIDEDLQDFLAENGIPQMPHDMATDIGGELMEYILGSAKRLVKILEQEESRPV